MKKIISLLFWAAAIVFAFSPMDNADAQGLTGSGFLKMNEKYQATYVSGFWDGAMVCCEVQEAQGGQCKFRDLMKVMDGVKYHQMIELLNKYLKDNPGSAHKPLGFLFYKCIAEAAANPQ